MKKRNIYVNRSQELLGLFEEAGSGTKLMCVPIDYAKKDHVAMFCNGYGDILRKPFSVKNSPAVIQISASTLSLSGSTPPALASLSKLCTGERVPHD